MANNPYQTVRQAPDKPRPKCEGLDPTYFDYEEYAQAALAVCANCQLRLWCLKTVDPKRNWHTGTVGGVLWRNGYAVPFPDFVPPVELDAYLEGTHA